jgi:hypothetical protein
MLENDAILPDDFQMDTPQSEEVSGDVEAQGTMESVEDTKPTDEISEPVQDNPFRLKLKYNHEELEVDEARARELAQMGMNYPKLQEKLQALESDPSRSFVEELAHEFNMTVPEYLEAVRAQKEQEHINELVQQGISEELAQEMLENRKFRQQFEQEKKAKAEEERKNAEYNDFFQYFRDANGRDFVPNQDEIPPTVWEAANQGVPLKFAYMMHENNQLRQQLQTLKQNESNAQKAPVGSTTAHGGMEIASEDDFLRGFNSI